MIARSWRGATSLEDADRYYEYLRRTGIQEYRETVGNRGVQVLRRDMDGKAEFLLITFWDSMDAVRRFAGPDPDQAVFYPEDEDFLVDRDEFVLHYDVLEGPD